jgi:hypothetical protein
MQKRLFYFTGVSPARAGKPERARVTVYAWQDGWWFSSLFFYFETGSVIGSVKDVPHYVLEEVDAERRIDTRRMTRPDAGGPRRAREKVDFTTGWEVVEFNPEVELKREVEGNPEKTETVSTGELVVREQSTQKSEKRYTVIDNGDLRRQELAEIVARQEAAFRELQRGLNERRPAIRDNRPRGTPDGMRMPDFPGGF